MLGAIFWGTNYTLEDIISKVKNRESKAMKRVNENLSDEMKKSILKKLK